jgi:hypothetical protein
MEAVVKRISLGILAAASLVIGGVACSQNSFDSVAVTKNPSVVEGCEKVADVTARKGQFDDSDAQTQLTRAAQAKGANTVLIANDAADKGTAYRCAMPSLASTGKKTSSTGSH